MFVGIPKFFVCLPCKVFQDYFEVRKIILFLFLKKFVIKKRNMSHVRSFDYLQLCVRSIVLLSWTHFMGVLELSIFFCVNSALVATTFEL